MSDPILLTNVSQSDYDNAEATLINLVRAAYPTLDLRRGTVIRDILIRPSATIYAYNVNMMNDLKSKMSLITIQSNPDATAADMDAILANFGVTRNEGNKAIGQVLVRVDGNRVYTLSAGSVFSTLEGLQFVTTQNYTVRIDPQPEDIQLRLSDDGTYYYFILPITASEVGAAYNIQQGTVMDPQSPIYGYVSSEAYVNFSAGIDSETINEIIARLPAAVSYKALESRTSIDSKLRTQFDGTDIQIQALSVQGYGDSAQLRDKHNPIGFAVGSRVDVYARTFTAPITVVLQKTGTLIAPNTYQFTIDIAEAPGFYSIRAISELSSVLSNTVSSLPALGSYAFLDVRYASGINNTFHDIDPDNSMIEAAYTVYQKATITVTGVPVSSDTHDFKVEVYVAPGLTDIQTFFDTTEVRNLESDYLARCPLICLVNMDAKAYHNKNFPIDVEKMRQDVVDYINSRSFVARLTRSEIACIMHADGASRIDLGSTGMLLQGVVRDAAGVIHTISGDSLAINTIENAKVLLTSDTVVFACEPGSIHIEAVAE